VVLERVGCESEAQYVAWVALKRCFGLLGSAVLCEQGGDVVASETELAGTQRCTLGCAQGREQEEEAG